jgi:hypothetical protein
VRAAARAARNLIHQRSSIVPPYIENGPMCRSQLHRSNESFMGEACKIRMLELRRKHSETIIGAHCVVTSFS